MVVKVMDGQGVRGQEARVGCGRTHEMTIVHGDGRAEGQEEHRAGASLQ